MNKYTNYNFNGSVYNKLDLMSFAYYNNLGVFQDFYLTTVLSKLPEASTSLVDDEVIGNIGVVLKLTSDRTQNFFNTAQAVDLIDLSLTPED